MKSVLCPIRTKPLSYAPFCLFFFLLFSLLDVYFLYISFKCTIWNALVMVLRCVSIHKSVGVSVCKKRTRCRECEIGRERQEARYNPGFYHSGAATEMSCEIQARLPFHIASTHLVAAYGIKQENEKALNQMHIKWLFAVVWNLKWNEANRKKNEEKKNETQKEKLINPATNCWLKNIHYLLWKRRIQS